MINPQLEQWLHSNGYEHYVFISYPNAEGAEVKRCAGIVAREIRRRFADFSTLPSCRLVFVDNECIPNGEVWERYLQTALCKSVIMVAVCAPVYYESTHSWCGREYQAMLSLSESRRAPALVPVVVRRFQDYPLPPAVERLQFIDIANESARDPSFFTRRHAKFGKVLDQIVERAVNVASTLRANNAVATNVFPFPDRSAFEDYNARYQAAPFRLSQ